MNKQSIIIPISALFCFLYGAGTAKAEPRIVRDLDCNLTAEGRTDSYIGCAVVGDFSGSTSKLAFVLEDGAALYFVGDDDRGRDKFTPVAVSIDEGDSWVPVTGSCWSQPRVVTCRFTMGGTQFTVEAFNP